MFIPSQHRLTIVEEGMVILEFDDAMTRPLDFSTMGESQLANYAGAEDAALFGRGNASGSISWGRIQQYASHAEAQSFQIGNTARLPIGLKRTLKIEIQSGATYQLDGFVLEEYRPAITVRNGFPLNEEFTGTWAGLTVTDSNGIGGVTMSAITDTHAAITATHHNYEPS